MAQVASSASSSSAAAASPAAAGNAPVDPDVMTSAELASLQLDTTPSARLPLVYSDSYNIGFWGVEKLHPFDSKKYAKVHAALTHKATGIAREAEFHAPIEAPPRLLRLVHPAAYLSSLKSSLNVAKILEVPPVAILPNFLVQSKALKPMRIATAGTLLGAELAVRHIREPRGEAAAEGSAAASSSSAAAAAPAAASSSAASSSSAAAPAVAAGAVLPGWSINLGGGFHHCSAHSGGGFCPYADISLAILYLAQRQSEPRLTRFMILDLDAHQGNGHENDKLDGVFDRAGLQVFIMDMYNSGIYPHDARARQAIDCEVRLAHGTGDEEYLAKLRKNLARSLAQFKPQLLIYNAGTDCLAGDPLGNLSVSAAGIVERDRIVFEMCLAAHVPLVMLLSGGYQQSNAAVIAASIANLQEKLHLWEIDPQILAVQAEQRAKDEKKKGKSKIKSEL